MKAEDLVTALGIIVEKKLEAHRALILQEIRTIVRQEISDQFNTRGMSQPVNAKPLTDDGDYEDTGDVDRNALKQRMAEINSFNNAHTNHNVIYDENNRPIDTSRAQGSPSVKKITDMVKNTDYSHLL